MHKATWTARWPLLIALSLLAACGPKRLEVRAAQPEPAAQITAPKILTEPVQRPSWMPRPIASLLGWKAQQEQPKA